MAEMRHYERGGVTVDQCSECRGIFLDRGELERLIDAETAFHNYTRAPQPQPVQPRYEERRYEQPRYDRDRDYHQKRKKRGSFFEELFD